MNEFLTKIAGILEVGAVQESDNLKAFPEEAYRQIVNTLR